MSNEQEKIEYTLPEGRDPLWVCEQWTLHKLSQWEEELTEEGMEIAEITVPGYVAELEIFWNRLASCYNRKLQWTDSDALLSKVLDHSQKHAGYEYLDWDVTMIRWLIRKVKKRMTTLEQCGILPHDDEMEMLHYLAFGFYWEEQRMWQVLGEEKRAKRAMKNAKDHSVYVILGAMRKFM
ncbi:MAG: hypothetical protein IKT45_00435 [Lachnospiraceae bacterium]|nr:hypothetical protein [Lachnospiraceae bacterium]